MPLDPNIPLSVKPVQFESPVNMMGQMYQLQNALQAGQINQLKMQEMERDTAERNAMRPVVSRPDFDISNPLHRRELMAVAPVAGAELINKMATGAKTFSELETAKLAQTKSQLSLAAQILSTAKDQPSYDAALQKLQSHGLPTQQMPSVYNPQYVQSELMQGVEMDKQLTHQIERQRLGLEGQRVGLEARRVGIAEQQQRQASDLGFQQQLAQAKEMGAAAAKGDVAALQAYPKAVAQAEQTVNLIDQMIGKRYANGELMRGEKVHPGFESAVGMGTLGTLGIPGLAQITPATDAADFKSLFDQVKGGAFLQAFEALKGGGAITEKEGEKGTAALTRMSLAQSEKEFVKAATEFQDIVRAGAQRANQRVSKIDGISAPAAPAAPATPPQSVIRVPSPAAPAAASGFKFLGFEEQK